MDMHHIRYFLAVCDTLNFTRAAGQCNVTQPALSRAIQQLEAEVDGLVFRREGKLTHLTDLGKLLKPKLEHVLRHAEEAKTAARRFLTLESAQLTLGVMCTIGPRRFASFLADFQAQNRGVELSLIDGRPEALVDRIEAGEIDLAVMASTQPFPERFEVRPLYREGFSVAFPAWHRFARLAAVPVRELHGESYLSRVNCEYAGHLRNLCAERRCSPRSVHESEREDWIMDMVAAGLGVCLLPEFSAIAPGVMTRPLIEPEVRREVCMVSVSGRRYSPAVMALLRSIQGFDWSQNPGASRAEPIQVIEPAPDWPALLAAKSLASAAPSALAARRLAS